jgi:hypothetical protein
MPQSGKHSAGVLMNACQSNDLPAIRRLVASGASFELHDKAGNTCLYYALMFGSADTLWFMLQECPQSMLRRQGETLYTLAKKIDRGRNVAVVADVLQRRAPCVFASIKQKLLS